MPSATPAEVLAQRRQLTLSGDIDGLTGLYAPDAVIEFAFAGPPGAPARLEGRDAIREHSRRALTSGLRIEEYEVTELHQTQDPEVVIVEMRAKATLTTTGQALATTSIQILRIREGQIAFFRDFADPRVLENLTGEQRPPQGKEMFARVVTAEAGAGGFDSTISRFQQQLPAATQQPGFEGFYLLTNPETGKLITISLWETREHMRAVEEQIAKIRDHEAADLGLTPPQLETYDVTLHA